MNNQHIKVAMSWILALMIIVAVPACQPTNYTSGSEFSDCEDCPTMVVIPAGNFMMGSLEGEEGRPEGPIHEVNIGYEFAVGKFEVTNGQFAEFVQDTEYAQGNNCIVWTDKWEALDDTSWSNPGFARAPLENEPVSCMSWHDAKAYVAWLSAKTEQPYRLPSESEWEYVARAGTKTRFVWGDMLMRRARMQICLTNQASRHPNWFTCQLNVTMDSLLLQR